MTRPIRFLAGPASGLRVWAGTMLTDDDPRWNEHSGGGRTGFVEWQSGDGTRAARFYAALTENARLIFDLLMDSPGQPLSADWIADQLRERRSGDTDEKRRRMVSGSLQCVHRPFEEAERRLPFYWWKGRNGEASCYAMKPSVAALFQAARHGDFS